MDTVSGFIDLVAKLMVELILGARYDFQEELPLLLPFASIHIMTKANL
jgi:hypothetical protein